MEVQLTEDQKAFIHQSVERGRYNGEEDALRDVLSLWEERERYLAEIRADRDVSEAEAARREGRWLMSHEENAQLAHEIHERGMARLAAEANRP